MDSDVVMTGEPASVKKARRKAKLVQERNDVELEAVVNTPGGAYLIWRILEECGVYRSAPSVSGEQLAYNEGRRQVGLWLMSELVSIDEKLYTKVRNIGYHRNKGSEVDGTS